MAGYCAAWGKALQDFLGADEFGFSILYKAGMRPCLTLGKHCSKCFCCRATASWAHKLGRSNIPWLLCRRLVKD